MNSLKLLRNIFKKHYTQTFGYILDVLGLAFAIKVLLQLNGATVIINQYQDLAVYGVLAILGIRLMGGYSMMLRFTSLLDVSRIAAGLFIATVLFGFYTGATTRLEFRYLVLLFYFSITVLMAYRVGVRLLYHRSIAVTEKTPTLLFGAGTNGLNAQRALMNSSSIQVLGFVDDDPAKIGRSIEGLPVYGMKGLAAVVAKKEVAQVVLTSEKLSVGRKKELFDFLSALGVKVFTVPSVDQGVQGGAQGNALKSIKIEDLLKRDAIAIDLARNKAVYAGKRILVTGAAGSIGAEIVTQLLPFGPAELLLLDTAETPLFHLKNQLGAQYTGKVSYHVASVLDHQYLERLFQDTAGIDVVFHAAAYKHVFMMEQQPQAAILNNILGTKQLIDLSIQHQVAQLVLVSTDKAVNPSNVMGASKRIAELYLAACMEKAGQTKLITTRFGNVLGSNGSVVPIFSAQIAAGGPVTVTHPEITRYFMTIPEACQLVLEAGAIGAGGEVFVFDMGDPVKIKDLAVNMIRLSGLVEDQDIKIEYSGLRPGEKLYEELLTDKEDLLPSHNPLIFKAKKETLAATLASGIAILLEMAAQGATAEALVKQMKKLVPEFKSMHSPFEKLD